MTERGVIRNRNYRSQIADMSGLCYGTGSPTDIDAVLDFGGWLFILIERKYNGAELLTGQRLALEHLCDAAHDPPRRYAYAIVADHYQPAPADIDFAAMRARCVRRNGSWRPLEGRLSVREVVDILRAGFEKKRV